MSEVIKLSADNFNYFMNVISLISANCNDMVIHNGIIRQKSNTKAYSFDIDVRQIFGERSMILSNVKMKEKALSIFKKNPNDVEIIIDEEYFMFRDAYSDVRFRKPLEQYITNKFITEDEITNIVSMREENGEIFSVELERFMVDRLKIISDTLSAIVFRVQFSGRKAELKLRSSDKESSMSSLLMTVDNLEQELKGYTAISVQPFLIPVEKFDMTLWFNTQNRVVTKISTSIGGPKESKGEKDEKTVSNIVIPIDMYYLSLMSE
jgi:hypothetical protein